MQRQEPRAVARVVQERMQRQERRVVPVVRRVRIRLMTERPAVRSVRQGRIQPKEPRAVARVKRGKSPVKEQVFVRRVTRVSTRRIIRVVWIVKRDRTVHMVYRPRVRKGLTQKEGPRFVRRVKRVMLAAAA